MTISFGLGVDVASIPDVFALHQNYPNPFNPTTQIRYDLPEEQNVTIAIYDVMGRNIRTLMNVNQTAGYHSFVGMLRDIGKVLLLECTFIRYRQESSSYEKDGSLKVDNSKNV